MRYRQELILFLAIIASMSFQSCISPAPHTKPHHKVRIKQMKFVPDSITVNIGDSITFINKDVVSHDVTEEKSKKWTSKTLKRGETWSMIASEDVNYFCSLHVIMKGKIRIK